MSNTDTADLCDLGVLDAAVDRALIVDWSLIPDAQLVQAAEKVAVVSAKVDALLTQIAGAVAGSGVWAEHEFGTPAALLRSLAPNRHHDRASNDVGRSNRLAKMPIVAAAFNAGLVTVDHVRLLGRCLDARFEGAFEAFEEELVGYAIALPYREFKRLIEQWKTWAEEASATDRELKDEKAREVYLARSFNNRGILKGTLTPIARSVVGNELRRLEEKLFAQDWAQAVARLGEGNVTKHDLKRTTAQRRHDAMVWMAMRSAVTDAGPEGPDPLVRVHTTEADMVAALEQDAGLEPERPHFSESMCELSDGTPISRRKLTRLLIRAKVKRLVYGPKSEIIDSGRSARLFSKAQREAIIDRDRVCHCGCGLPGWLCEIDHVMEWRDGGRTDISNGRPHCHTSHLFKTNNRNRHGPPGTADPPTSPDPPDPPD